MNIPGAKIGSDGALVGIFTTPKLETVIYGPGCLSELGSVVERFGAERAFVVTGRTIASETGFVDRIRTLLGARFAGHFGGVTPHTPQGVVLEAAAAARSAGADILISLGGGSAVDATKMVALCQAEGIKQDDAFAPYRMRLIDGAVVPPATHGNALPHVAIPTTLSGAEFSQFGGCTDTASGRKHQYRHPDLAPRVVIQDPELTTATPAWLWGSTGVRAIDHCVETLYSTNHQPFSDGLAVQALSLLFQHLPAAVADPGNLAARGRCQVAAWLSLFSLSNVMVGLSHAIGHQLGGRCNVPHGVTSCLMLAAVMDFNRSASAPRLKVAAQAMGLDVRDLDDDEAAAAAADRVRTIVREIGIKDRLRDWGVEESDIAPIAEGTMSEFLLATNPRPVTDASAVRDILRSVY